MSVLRRLSFLVLIAFSAACMRSTGNDPIAERRVAPESTPAPQTADGSTSILLPMIETAPPAPRILFLAGSFVPESGYPHSRVYDDGVHAESFSQLRTRVLKGELGFDVDEYVLTGTSTISAALLAPYAVVVLGSNDRALQSSEVDAFIDYATNGGALLTYADFQYGPNNWSSDNDLLRRFDIEVFPDNFQPTTRITDIVPSHPVMHGVNSFATEGSSQFLIRHTAREATTILARCAPLDRPGCALQEPERARVGPNDEVVCTWVRLVGRGRLAGTCDRNTFHNGPGVGTALSEFDNERYAANLFRWLATGR